MKRYLPVLLLLCLVSLCAAGDMPEIPATYKDYHFASETNHATHVVTAMQSTQQALDKQFKVKQTNHSGVIYRVKRSGSGYTVSCVPYVLMKDGQMGFIGGSSYFAILDEKFAVTSVMPGT